MREPTLSFLAALSVAGSSLLPAQELPWQINPKPSLILGDARGDANVLFGAGLDGATRLPDGRILVVDRGEYSLKLFAPDGKHLKNLGRKGNGPGEFNYLARLYRCGDQIIAYDIEGYQMSVFGLDGTFKRLFRFSSPQRAGGQPYGSSCNASGSFAHFGWGVGEIKPGVHRSNVPVWMTGADSGVTRVIGQVLGSERWAQVVDGRVRGSRPLALGRQPVIAMGKDRVYVGSADSYEIIAYDTLGRQVGTIRKPGVNLATTKADIDFALEREQAGQSEARQASLARGFAEMALPKTIPAYTKILVDADDLLWVQDYPRGKTTSTRWTVFTSGGSSSPK